MSNHTVQAVLADNIIAPAYATPKSAGMDVRANLKETMILKPQETARIPTGVRVALPEGLAMFIMARSGRALKGLQLGNGVGLLDEDYRDELGIIAYNGSDKDIEILAGERIAQLFFTKVERVEFDIAIELDTTDRKGGFGHTGRM